MKRMQAQSDRVLKPRHAGAKEGEVKLLIADDHALIRCGVRVALGAFAAEAEILEARDFATLIAVLGDHDDLDIALVDLNMPGMHGMMSLVRLREEYPGVPLVVISASDDPMEVQRALECGIAGFIPKSSPPEVMEQAIRLILAGGRYIPPALLRGRLGAASARQFGATASSGNDADATALSERQRHVLNALAQGLSNKAIARRLNLSEGTVKTHLAAIYRALNVHNRVSALAAMQRSVDKEQLNG